MTGKLLSYGSVASLLDCSDDTVRRLVRKGLLAQPRRYKGLGQRFSEADVIRYQISHAETEQVKSS